MFNILLFARFLFVCIFVGVGILASCPLCRNVNSNLLSTFKGKYYLVSENASHSSQETCGTGCVYKGPLDKLYCFQQDQESAFDVTDGQCEAATSSASGDWGEIDYCPTGSFASGFELKVLPLCSKRCKNDDDSGLLGIRLSCSSPDSSSIISTINSSIAANPRTCAGCGDPVFWTNVTSCPTGQFISGARYKFQPPDYTSAGDSDYDPSGGQNLDMSCSEGTILTGQGLSDTDGSAWLDWSYCPDGQLICGIRSRVDEDEVEGDNKNKKGQTDVQFSCCNK